MSSTPAIRPSSPEFAESSPNDEPAAARRAGVFEETLVHESPARAFALTPKQREERVEQLLDEIGVPRSAHDEYLAILQGHLDVALDGYLAQFRDP